MPTDQRATSRQLLLVRRGLVFVASSSTTGSPSLVRGVELELSLLGYVLSTRLRARLLQGTADELLGFRTWVLASLSAHLGADRRHEPLFRNFPRGVPEDTRELWWKKVLVHYIQAQDQPCLFCGAIGSTHVLSPCAHVVCDQCFDGSTYTACPVCEHHVDRSSPFFLAGAVQEPPTEKVTFRLLDLGEDETEATRDLFASLCQRKQALSPDDREALVVILRERGTNVLAWVPTKIPVRENVAIVLGTLFQECDPNVVLPLARRHMTTATDVLRFIAVLSGADGSLQAETVLKTVDLTSKPSPFWGKVAAFLGAKPPSSRQTTATIPVRVYRFKGARLRRPLRRALLGVLEGLSPDLLVEDMLRHRSYWVGVGEFLHPSEYAARFPNVARAFEVVRGKTPDGHTAPTFKSWAGQVEDAFARKSTGALLPLLEQRAGELARRFDRALRLAGDDSAAVDAVVASLVGKMQVLSTPVLLTLRSHLPARAEKAPVRIYWPKGRFSKGVSAPDTRAVLPRRAIDPAVRAIDDELLRRLSQKTSFDTCIVDDALKTVMVPFNERTASSAAVSLPRGSSIGVPDGKTVRLFLHWCQPEQDGRTTDLDLSVGLYDEAWNYVGVCSYYQLTTKGVDGDVIATSAGDLRDAPWPDGATEFVDLNRDSALSSGVRYAVMVVNNYHGMPFSLLERGFAGLMLRDDPHGQHFDPRTVELTFNLDGENGVFLPLVLDVRQNRLHWLDVHAKGEFQFNNVASSNKAITKVCPELMGYFASGVRPSMFDLALLHAAARCQIVFLRGQTLRQFVRGPHEDIHTFHGRLVRGQADEPRARLPSLDAPSTLAILHRGDLDLPSGDAVYALFRERVAPSLAASDLLS